MRLIHTSDWHIGKSFGFADDDTLAVLQDQRLEAISIIGRLARAERAGVVLVAGDVWDVAQPASRTMLQPIERMRQFPDLHWHLIAGNHDPHAPGGVWDRLTRTGLPDNVHAHLTPDAVPLGEQDGRPCWLLPAVLRRRHDFGDPTAPMEQMPTPDGTVRIGLAHGSVREFGSTPGQTGNLIADDRAQRSGLSYLALGDWHGQRQVDARTWYSGTPERDGFDRGGDGGGSVLLVEIEPSGMARTTPHAVGRFGWHRERATLMETASIDALEARLRGLHVDDPSTVLAWLDIDGELGPADLAHYQARIRDGVGSALRLLRVNDRALLPRLGAGDLAALGSGALRDAAEALARTDPDPDRLAAAALQRLLLLARQEGLV